MPIFTLDSQLAADCHLVGDFPLSTLLLLDDHRYPWTVLVPRIASIREIYELSDGQRLKLLNESCAVGAFMLEAFGGDKLNIGALGNLVPQLHVHHVVRNVDDPAWPGPVWGHSPREPYGRKACQTRVEVLRAGLDLT